MDYLGELIVLGVDSLIFGMCLKQYFHCKSAITAVKVCELFISLKKLFETFLLSLFSISQVYKLFNRTNVITLIILKRLIM